MSEDEIIIERPTEWPNRFSMLEEMRVERGTSEDWEALHELHYKSEGGVVGPTYYRCMLADQLVGVVVLSSPKLLLGGRNLVFPKLKPGNDNKRTNTHRAHYVNRQFSVNSRTVVDTLFRASGVSYRMLNLAARLHGKRYLEIQSSMSRFNPFAIRAGFRFVRLKNANAYEKGLVFMAQHFETHPGDLEGLLGELEGFSAHAKERTLKEIREFYYRHSAMEKTGGNLGMGTSKVEAYSPRELLKKLQQLLFAAPMYGVYRNPDEGRELPLSLPLVAFDEQPTDEPLRRLEP